MKKSIKTNEKKKEKAVVTGGAGFIGSHITDALIEHGYEVHVIDDLSGGKKENVNKKAKFHATDIRDTDALRKIMKGASYVFHCAALPRVQRSIEFPELTNDVNINGTLSALLAARDAKVKRFVYSASSSAYGDQKTMPLHEGLLPNPKSPYGLQKYVGEHYAKVFADVYGLQTVSLRYFSVYGPRFSLTDGPYTLVIGKFLQQKQNGLPLTITGDGRQTRDFTHISDVVKANLLAIKSKKVGRGEVINIGAGNNVSIKHLAALVGGPVEFVEARLEPKHTKADNRKAKELLGWEQKISLEEGLKQLKKHLGLD